MIEWPGMPFLQADLSAIVLIGVLTSHFKTGGTTCGANGEKTMVMRTMAGKAYRLLIEQAQSRHIRLTDEHINWLLTINAGFLHYGNPYLFDHVMKNIRSEAPFIEIGSYCGLSTNVLTHFKTLHGRTNTLFTCDRWEFEDCDGMDFLPGTDIPMSTHRQFVKGSFIRNVEMYSAGQVPHTIEMFSDEFFEAWRAERKEVDVFGREALLGGPISFAYIDGNHSLEFAQRDFENCDTFLERDGFIVFDDSSDAADFGSTKVAQEAAKSRSYEVVAKNPNYLLKKIK